MIKTDPRTTHQLIKLSTKLILTTLMLTRVQLKEWWTPPKCQMHEQFSWEQTSIYQLGDIDSAGRTVCPQQTDSLDESIHNWALSLRVWLRLFNHQTLVLLQCLLWLILKSHCIDQHAAIILIRWPILPCHLYVPCVPLEDIFLILKGDNIRGFKMTGILACFTQCLSISPSTSLSIGWSQVNLGRTSQKIWNRLKQGEHPTRVCVCFWVFVWAYQSDSNSLYRLLVTVSQRQISPEASEDLAFQTDVKSTQIRLRLTLHL